MCGSCDTLNDLFKWPVSFKQNKRFKFNSFKHDYRNKWIQNIKKPISCQCKCKFDGKKCNSNQKWNNDKCQCECKNLKEHVCEKGYIWNPATFSCINGKYLARVIDNWVTTCDEIIDTTKTVPAKSTSINFYILLTLLLITITLLIAVNFYCYLKIYWAKQKHLLPYTSQITN